jgi:8-oxo-dGTP diphosphatase
MIDRFNIRVYFILQHPTENKILLSDEIIRGSAYTKLPGGGLEYGEGPEDAARREAIEELGQEIEIVKHLHTTPFFQQSAFKSSDQVIAIYYLAKLKQAPTFKIAEEKFDFIQTEKNDESFRWAVLGSELIEEMSFPTDKAAIECCFDGLRQSN